VRYRARNAKPEVTECHCTQCRKQTGHRFATTATETSNITVNGADSITWFRTSPEAERGFCAVCGSTLFWKMSKRDYSGILAASVDEPNGLHLNKHIFVDDKGDYYEITDGMPQYEGYEKLVTEN
jgi:hypothetical protein